MSILQNWVFDYLMKVKGSISPFDRSVFIAPYSSPGAITADAGWYQTFGQDIADLRTYPKLRTPALGIGGIGYPLLATFLKQYAAHYTLIELKNTGHWVPEERPRETTEALVRFFQ